jgi:hypothetical protein
VAFPVLYVKGKVDSVLNEVLLHGNMLNLIKNYDVKTVG